MPNVLEFRGGKRLVIGERPLVMGVLNVTPDSFSDGGLYLDPDAAVARGRALAAEGADLIDVGGESTRPGGVPVSAAEEIARILPVIERLAGEVPVPLSVDTYRAATAARALDAGADIVNDVTALRADPELAAVAARRGAAVVLMHSTGLPGHFHDAANLGAPLPRVLDDLKEAAARARAAGIAADRIFLDPGIGFGKTLAENLVLVREVGRIRALGYPVVLGPSMKSFIARTLDESDMRARAHGTAAAVAIAAFLGVDVIRVHDVATMRRVAQVAHAVRSAPDA
ncbi:MAG TPA: dihydropteroate synthase [Thermodesulfobacteriota bacterium]